MNSKGLKEKLSALSDMQLYNLLYAVAIASGLGKEKAQTLTSDIPRLRRMLMTLNDEQIGTMLASLGQNNGVNDIIERL